MKNSPPLRILIVSDHTYLPDRNGGRESSIHDLAERLTQLGHLVAVIANRGPLRDLPRVILKRAVWKQRYKIIRVRNEKETSLDLLTKNQYDIAIYNVLKAADYLSPIKELSKRQLFFIRDAEDSTLQNFRTFNTCGFIANSQFIASLIEEKTGQIPFIFPPFIELSQYKNKTTREFVTFINPIPVKGVETAIALATRCNDVNFLFIEGWPLSKTQRNDLKNTLRQHKNIRLTGSITEKNKIFSSTKVLLVPSQCEEAFGRVVLEAQISGIPVIATNIGGLPESVGKGGVLIPPEAGIDAWQDALIKICNDTNYYTILADLAKTNAECFHQSNTQKLLEFTSWLEDISNKAH